MAAIDKKSLLKRLFDRIGISKDEQQLLTEGEDGIKNLLDLVVRDETVCSAKTNRILNEFMVYMNANIAPDGGPCLFETLNQLINIDKWAKNSWEMFICARFNLDTNLGGFEVLSQREEAAKRDNAEHGIGKEQTKEKNEKDTNNDN